VNQYSPTNELLPYWVENPINGHKISCRLVARFAGYNAPNVKDLSLKAFHLETGFSGECLGIKGRFWIICREIFRAFIKVYKIISCSSRN